VHVCMVAVSRRKLKSVFGLQHFRSHHFTSDILSCHVLMTDFGRFRRC
jgi:hypothetical protein